MNPCATTRLLFPAFLAGLSVATLTGSGWYGWLAGAAVVALLVIVQRALGRTGSASCAWTPPGPEAAAEQDAEANRSLDRTDEAASGPVPHGPARG